MLKFFYWIISLFIYLCFNYDVVSYELLVGSKTTFLKVTVPFLSFDVVWVAQVNVVALPVTNSSVTHQRYSCWCYWMAPEVLRDWMMRNSLNHQPIGKNHNHRLYWNTCKMVDLQSEKVYHLQLRCIFRHTTWKLKMNFNWLYSNWF